MTERNTHDVATLLAQAMHQPADARSAFLDRACAGNSALRRDLHELLAANDQAGDFLQRAAIPTGALRASAMTQQHASSPTEGVGSMIGRYKLLQLIGEGGFGSVFMAEQTEPVRRMVALKIIKLGMDTRQVIARFEVERQALAMMDHPNIARVLDAGATTAGRPYFVMELVKGIPITEYCDQNNLTTRQRLELFMPVCQAVQHAHQKGIIHRDIKPSNVLVTLHDGTPVPKVIDFGIAKATSARLTEKTLFTEFRQLIGTPEYMSPEQAEMSGLDIDTRSDVYSLGVLLYELLTGTTPFDSRTLRDAGYAEIQRIIREVEPPKPSTRVSTLGERLTGVAAHRGIEARKLGSLMRGELDWIVMKAMEKDRTRRYDTANGLAGDVQRFLANEPVSAGPPSTTYRLRKFVRRNRGPVVAGAVIAFALLLGIAGSTVSLLHAQQERDRAVLAEVEQKRLREQSEQIASFMQKTLGGAGPRVAVGRDATLLRELMDAAAQRIADGELKSSPEAELQLRLTIGDVYRQLSAFDRAEAMLGPAIELSEALHPGDHETTAQALNQLALMLDAQRKLDAGLRTSQAALDMARRLHPEDHEMVAAAMLAHGELLHQLNRVEECERITRDGIAMYERLGLGDHMFVAEGWKSLASMERERGDLAAAETLYRKAFETHRRTIVGDHPALAGIHQSLGLLYYNKGDFAQAEQSFRASLEMNQRLYRGDHLVIAKNLDALGGIARANDDLPGALALLEQSMEMRMRLVGLDGLDAAESMRNVGIIKYDMGDFDGAITLMRRSLEIQRRHLPMEHPDTNSTLGALATALHRKGEYAEAAGIRRELLDSSRHATPFNPAATSRVMTQLAYSLLRLGDFAQAEQVLRECLSLRAGMPTDGSQGQPAWLIANTRSMLAEALIGQAANPALELDARLAKLHEAEPLAVESAKAMEADPATPREPENRVSEARDRVVRLYVVWEIAEPGKGWAEKAESWRVGTDGSAG